MQYVFETFVVELVTSKSEPGNTANCSSVDNLFNLIRDKSAFCHSSLGGSSWGRLSIETSRALIDRHMYKKIEMCFQPIFEILGLFFREVGVYRFGACRFTGTIASQSPSVTKSANCILCHKLFGDTFENWRLPELVLSPVAVVLSLASRSVSGASSLSAIASSVEVAAASDCSLRSVTACGFLRASPSPRSFTFLSLAFFCFETSTASSSFLAESSSGRRQRSRLWLTFRTRRGHMPPFSAGRAVPGFCAPEDRRRERMVVVSRRLRRRTSENLELMFEIHEFLREYLVPSELSLRLRILGRRDGGFDAALDESAGFEGGGWVGVASRGGGEGAFEGCGGAFFVSTGEAERERELCGHGVHAEGALVQLEYATAGGPDQVEKIVPMDPSRVLLPPVNSNAHWLTSFGSTLFASDFMAKVHHCHSAINLRKFMFRHRRPR
ncbi:hypothetical protein KCU85_g412, partial [Aureobasidium melanogenum]